jgi:hypothetical protein
VFHKSGLYSVERGLNYDPDHEMCVKSVLKKTAMVYLKVISRYWYREKENYALKISLISTISFGSLIEFYRRVTAAVVCLVVFFPFMQIVTKFHRIDIRIRLAHLIWIKSVIVEIDNSALLLNDSDEIRFSYGKLHAN